MRAAIAEARVALGLPDPGAAPGQEPLFPDLAPDLQAVTVGAGADAPALLLHGPWPVGIIGLVAGRLADETGRPAVVGTRIGDVIRASCRSDGRLDLASTLTACGDLFVRFGGHAAAAGFELPIDRWDEFTRRFTDSPRPPRRKTRGRCSRWTSRCRPPMSTTRCSVTWRGSRRAAPATRTRWSPSSG